MVTTCALICDSGPDGYTIPSPATVCFVSSTDVDEGLPSDAAAAIGAGVAASSTPACCAAQDATTRTEAPSRNRVARRPAAVRGGLLQVMFCVPLSPMPQLRSRSCDLAILR